MLDAAAREKYRTLLDLSDAYSQPRVHPDNAKYNSFKTAFGGFISHVMLQGDTNAPSTFMRVIEDLLSEYLNDFVWVYIDDILIFSDTLEEHIEHVTKVCQKLAEAKFYASPEKSKFLADKPELLGHVITSKGIETSPDRVKSITDWTIPINQKELQRFLGVINFVSQFLPHYASIIAPLTNLTGNAEFIWTETHT